MKKLFLAYILVLTLVLTGCMGQLPGIKKPTDSSGSSSEKPAAEKRVVSLAVSTTDSFCPYNAVTLINRDVSTLLYDSLVRLDNKFTAHEQLAKKIEISEKTVTVTLKSVSFADGSPLTADDVVYCAERAKKSDTRYADSLRDVTSVSAASSNTVVFTLKKVDPFFKNQLDFPIYKQNSDDQTSSDNLEIPPIGCGQ